MKYLLFFFIILAGNNRSAAQAEIPVTKIFIVRHTEKETGNDPALTATGKTTAGELNRTLQNENKPKN